MSMIIPNVEDFKYIAPKNPLPGVRWIERKKVKLSDINYDANLNKIARLNGVNPAHTKALEESYKAGVDTSRPLPVLEKTAGLFEKYAPVDYFHRGRAQQNLGWKEYVFDIYEFADEKAKVSFQLLMNDHPPQGAASTDDIVQAGIKLIQKNKLAKNENAVSKWVKIIAPKKHASTRGNIVKKICQQTKTRQAWVTYSKKDLEKFYDNYGQGRTKAGAFDITRDMYGYDVQTKYESTYATRALKRLSESGKKSYFVLHTDSPIKNKDGHIMRTDMLRRLKNIESSLKYFVKWYNKHKKMPWDIVGFLPQEDGEDETKIVKTTKYEKKI